MTLTRVTTSMPADAHQSAGCRYVASRSTPPRRKSFEQGGRSYGGSASRPTSRTEPSNPRSRSSSAHEDDATPPPTSRTSTSRSATGERPRELRGDDVLEPGVQDEQHLVAGLDDGVLLGHEAAAVAQHADDQRALRQLDVGDLLPGGRRVVGDLELDDLELLLLQREQVHQPVARHLVLDEPQDQVGRADRGLDAEQLEVLQVPRVVDAGDDAVDEVLLLGHLPDEQVVLVVAGHRDHQVGALDARALQHPQLRAVAVLHRVLELLLDHEVAAPVGLDQRHLLALLDELSGEVPADLAAADDEDVHGLDRQRFAEHVDRVLRRRDGLQSLLAIPGRAGRIHHTDDHAARFEAPLGDLRDDDVRVVAVGRGDEDVGAVDAGLEQRVDLQGRPDGEQAAAVLPRALLAHVEALMRQRVLVEDRYLMSGGKGGLGHG